MIYKQFKNRGFMALFELLTLIFLLLFILFFLFDGIFLEKIFPFFANFFIFCLLTFLKKHRKTAKLQPRFFLKTLKFAPKSLKDE